MTANYSRQGRAIELVDRHSERDALDRLIGTVRTGQSQALVIRQAADEVPELPGSMLALVELIEAASRSGQTGLAASALSRLAEATSVGQTDLGQGIYARCRALVGEGADTEGWYRQAVDRLSRTGMRTELARAHLLYGEWLRRGASCPTLARNCAPRTTCSTRWADRFPSPYRRFPWHR